MTEDNDKMSTLRMYLYIALLFAPLLYFFLTALAGDAGLNNLFGFPKTVDFDKSVVRNGQLYEAVWRNGQPYEPNSEFGRITTIWGWKPFSGTVVRYYENGQMMWKKNTRMDMQREDIGNGERTREGKGCG